MVPRTGIVEKREETQTQQIYQYTISLGAQLQVEFELPARIATLQSGQSVKVSISLREPKNKRSLLTLRGEVYDIAKTKDGTIYTIVFAGLQGRIRVKRAIPGLKRKKALFLSISK